MRILPGNRGRGVSVCKPLPSEVHARKLRLPAEGRDFRSAGRETEHESRSWVGWATLILPTTVASDGGRAVHQIM